MERMKDEGGGMKRGIRNGMERMKDESGRMK
jgi:hypothetical protein